MANMRNVQNSIPRSTYMSIESVDKDDESRVSGQIERSNSDDMKSEISNSRRRFSRLSLGSAPIVMSLVTKPVLGAQCLSNMLSGNLSDPNRGNCTLGTSPGGWGNPGGSINGVSDKQAWDLVGYSYGTSKPTAKNSKQASSYGEGTTVAALPSGLMTQSPSTKTLREVLLSEGHLNRDRHVLTAWLNAKFSENSGGAFTYVLTTAQVIGLANGSIELPKPYLDLNKFLDSTWK
jgi:hypothetical protein